MRIGLLSSSEKKPTGVAKYANALYENMLQLDDNLCCYSIADSELSISGVKNIPVIGQSDNLQLSYPVYAFKFDILHGNVRAYSIAKGIHCARIQTIHDLRPLSRREWDSEAMFIYFNTLIRNTAVESDCVITVSEYSKSEIIDYYNIDEDKVFVTYQGTYPEEKFLLTGNKPKIKDIEQIKYLLYVSGIDPNKNQDGLIKAYSLFRIRYPKDHIKLVIAGKTRKTEYMEKLKKLEEYCQFADDIIFTGYTTDDELVWLYRNALAVTYVSFFEGFGLPVLEAMSLGKAVISSNATSLPEVGGDAVCYCNPYVIEDIACAIEKVVFRDSYRHELEQKAIQRAKLFSYKKTAEQTLSIFRKFA